MVVLSKTERKFLEDLKRGDISKWDANYKRQLKHNILKKRKRLTEDLLLVNELLDKLETV
jgi:hypothetical protein